MSKYRYEDYKGDNWDDSAVIDKLPLKEVVAEYRQAGQSEELIYGWCIWRRELNKYRQLKKQMGPAWSAEHSTQITWNMEHDILQDCRENDLMDMWYYRQRIEKPWRMSFEDYAETVDAIYRQYGSIEQELMNERPEVKKLFEIAKAVEQREQQQKEVAKKKRGLFHRH